MKRIYLTVCTAVLAFGLSSAQRALATTVFKSVDENGVTSFSDTAPDTDAPVETIKIDVQPPRDPELSRQNLEAMRETTDRMAKDRREREEQRAELRKQQTQATSQPYYYDNSGGSIGAVGYSSSYRRHYRRPIGRYWWPINKPHPEHPIHRPPMVWPPDHGHGDGHHGDGRHGDGPIAVPYRNARGGVGSASWRPSINQRPGFSMNRGINASMRNR
jgi:hypothetical protein